MMNNKLFEKYARYEDIRFVTDSNSGHIYLIKYKNKKYTIYDTNGNIINLPVIKKGEYSEYHTIEKKDGKFIIGCDYNKNNIFYTWNLMVSNIIYYKNKFGGTFLGPIETCDSTSHMGTKIFNKTYVPAILFNSENGFVNARGDFITFRDDEEYKKYGYSKPCPNPWVIFFEGNDDMSLFIRCSTKKDAEKTLKSMYGKMPNHDTVRYQYIN